MMKLNQRLDQIESKILDEKFRTGRGTANEVNFWIFDYAPEDEMAVRNYIESLTQRINSQQEDIQIKCFDLFGLMIEILRENKYLDWLLKEEGTVGSNAIIQPLKDALGLTESDNLIIEKVMENVQPQKDVIFLTGVGKAWPVIRSHTILNNLHSKVDRNPLVMFFPGEYTSELKLFGEITDDNYYRAFKLV
jgi:hypothetical protein